MLCALMYLLRSSTVMSVLVLSSCFLSWVEGSFGVRDHQGCKESGEGTCSRESTRPGAHAVRGGLPGPAAWMLVALLSAIGGATACWLANLLAPPPGCGRKIAHDKFFGGENGSINTIPTLQKKTD